MNRNLLRALMATATATLAGGAFAQPIPDFWGAVCIDPENMMPRTNPYLFNVVQNDLMRCVMGLQGQVTYGGANGPCYNPGMTADIRGRFALSYGPVGSGQDTGSFDDGDMALTLGAPVDPFYCYSGTVVTDPAANTTTVTQFGQNAFNEFFSGFSNRYMWAVTVNDGIRARLQVEVVGDAIRMRWALTNTTANPLNVGILFGAGVGMGTFGVSSTGAQTSFSFGKPGFITLPNAKPPVTDKFFDRNAAPGEFPKWVGFHFEQSDAYGFRLENEASEATNDTILANKAAQADRFYLGKQNFVLGAPSAGGFPRAIVGDTTFLTAVAFAQEFPGELIAPGATVPLVHYVRSTWGESDYRLPFGVTVDARKTLSVTGQNQNNISPNPFPVRVYVDNVGGFGFDGKEFPLNNTRVTLSFEPNSGATIAGSNANFPYTRERTITVVQPRDLEFIDFSVTFDNTVTGLIPYTVRIESEPGDVVKEIKGVVNVASRAQVELYPDANMVGLPFNFQQSSLEAIFEPFLDPNVPNGDLQFYRYDPSQKGYVIINSATRGQGFWAIYSKTGDSPVLSPYAGTPRGGNNFLEQAPLIELKPGFNMIANPYNYRIPLIQITGVSSSNNQISRTLRELVDLGLIQSFVSSWNPITKDYELVPAEDGFMEPHRAYWINVTSQDDLTINYPPVNEIFVQGMTRRTAKSEASTWPQTESKWRMKLSARLNGEQDAENYVGTVTDARQASRLRVSEVPMAPVQKVGLSIEQIINGKASRMSQALADKTGRQEYKVVVEAKEAGQVTVTWPTLGTVPKNLRFRITDPATNVTRLLRQTSGYTFKMDKAGTRTLNLTVEEGGVDAAVIGNVVVSRNGRANNAPVTIAYTLGADATTSVRILSATGKEVYSVTRGRADRAGENTVTWNLRNSANQAVAPEAYRVEIVAESVGGERVRASAIVNVIR